MLVAMVGPPGRGRPGAGAHALHERGPGLTTCLRPALDVESLQVSNVLGN